MLVLDKANATHLCLIAAHYMPFLSFTEELKCSTKFHSIYCTSRVWACGWDFLPDNYCWVMALLCHMAQRDQKSCSMQRKPLATQVALILHSEVVQTWHMDSSFGTVLTAVRVGYACINK